MCALFSCLTDGVRSTSIVTNIRVKKGKKHRQFSWIESWTDHMDEATGQSHGMSLTLSDWFHEGILMDGGLLGIDPAYFSITGGRERWIYRVARKHAGGAGENGFGIPFATLFEKSGAEGTYRRFKFEMQAIIRRNDLPGFDLAIEHGVGEPRLRMTRRMDGDTRPQHQAAPQLIAKKAERGLEAVRPMPLFSPQLDEATIARVRKDFPGWDVYALKADFDSWIASHPDRTPSNYQAAFYGFVRTYNAREARS